MVLDTADALFESSFALVLIVTVAVVWRSKCSGSGAGKNDALPTAQFSAFQRNYLVVYFLMMAGDWLQGPYVYALYDSYGYTKSDIARLFVVGFGSSMVVGTIVGSLADRYGRKRFCLLYVALYIGSCLTKHSSNYKMLMLGRVLGGVATSLLFSAFESWMVREHNKRGFEGGLIGKTFSKSIFGNSCVAIASGVVAQALTSYAPLTDITAGVHYGGYTGPFDLAIVVLAAGGAVIHFTWSENYGGETAGKAQPASPLSLKALYAAWVAVRSDQAVLLTGCVQSLFEGAMYCFVFMWSPAVMQGMPAGQEAPFGLIFATFMICCMCGSEFFSGLMKRGQPPRRILLLALVCAAAGLLAAAVNVSSAVTFGGFLVFEVCVGLYFPSMGTLKSKAVPEEHRAAIYNLFRVPLNSIVLFVLLSSFSVPATFYLCVLLLGAAAALQLMLVQLLDRREATAVNAKKLLATGEKA